MHPLTRIAFVWLVGYAAHGLAPEFGCSREVAALLGAGIVCGGWSYVIGTLVRDADTIA